MAYQEDIFIGYRHYDLTGTIPLFPFGHGLSYTTLEYHDLQLTANNSDPNAEIELTLNLTNSGKRTGWEVVQLYLSDVESALPRPPQELKRFRKVCLEPGESIQLIFNLSRSDLAYYDADRKEWVAEPGEFIASVGSSSADIKYSKKFHWGHRL